MVFKGVNSDVQDQMGFEHLSRDMNLINCFQPRAFQFNFILKSTSAGLSTHL